MQWGAAGRAAKKDMLLARVRNWANGVRIKFGKSVGSRAGEGHGIWVGPLRKQSEAARGVGIQGSRKGSVRRSVKGSCRRLSSYIGASTAAGGGRRALWGIGTLRTDIKRGTLNRLGGVFTVTGQRRSGRRSNNFLFGRRVEANPLDYNYT